MIIIREIIVVIKIIIVTKKKLNFPLFSWEFNNNNDDDECGG